MPGSDGALRPWVAGALEDLGAEVSAVVDVGPGAGAWRDYLGSRRRYSAARWTGIEIWEPYVARFALNYRYDTLIIADIRQVDPLPDADLYIFGDVLEHMPADDAVTVWDRARQRAGWLVINMPVLDYPQGEMDGNPYEAHVHQWDTGSVLARFGGIVEHAGPVPGSTVGAFIARGT